MITLHRWLYVMVAATFAVAAPVTAQSADGCHRPASVGE
jgi:hypothetical protein